MSPLPCIDCGRRFASEPACASCDATVARLRAEVRALRRERRALRKALRPIVEAAYATDDLDHDTMNPQYHIEVTITVDEARAAKKALGPKARRRTA